MSGAVLLPSPSVRFAPDFLARLGRLTAQARGLRERREGAGRARLLGVGSEFVGHRPYRSGEDLRALDWSLLARLGRPYVRVSAREASEAWALFVDASASMGTGRPGKLQLAAECATALAALAVERRASATLYLSNEEEPLRITRRTELARLMARLEGARAGGERGLGALVAGPAARTRAGRWVFLGDFLDCSPGAILGLARGARELVLGRILAREEVAPPAAHAARWLDPESGRERTLRLGPDGRARYEERLERELETWAQAAARARALAGMWTSDAAFEDVAGELAA